MPRIAMNVLNYRLPQLSSCHLLCRRKSLFLSALSGGHPHGWRPTNGIAVIMRMWDAFIPAHHIISKTGDQISFFIMLSLFALCL